MPGGSGVDTAQADFAGNSGLGWHILLFGSSAARAIGRALTPIRSEDDMDLFMRETAERGDDSIARAGRYIRRKAAVFARLDDAGLRLRFGSALFLTMLAALGVVAVGGAEMACCAAALCVLWLAVAVEAGYAPVCAGMRQRYLCAMLLRALALTAMLPSYFAQYMRYGVSSNVVLQSAMIVTLGAHAALFLAFIGLNTRQPLLLRALSGVLGAGPALTAAAAIALCASALAKAPLLAAASVLRALGALAAFLGDRLVALMALGGIRLRYGAIYTWLLESGGMALMLLGAWLAA